MDGSATFSEDGNYRYELSRVWDYNESTLYWVCLNPSIAGPIEGDHTIKKIITFSKNNGYGRCTVLNLFAYIATHPKDLIMAEDFGINVIGPNNDRYIYKAAQEIRNSLIFNHGVVFAWGASVETLNEGHELFKRPEIVIEQFRGNTNPYKRIFYLTKTKNGYPGHPVRLPYSTTLKEWSN